MGGESQQNLVICDSKYATLDYTFIAPCSVQKVLSIRYVHDLLRYIIALKKLPGIRHDNLSHFNPSTAPSDLVQCIKCINVTSGTRILFGYKYTALGPLLFLIHVNDLPKTVNDRTVPILFADDTSIIVKSPNSRDFQTNMVTAFHCVNKWFKVNIFSINIDKTHYIQFKTKNKPTLNINIV